MNPLSFLLTLVDLMPTLKAVDLFLEIKSGYPSQTSIDTCVSSLYGYEPLFDLPACHGLLMMPV